MATAAGCAVDPSADGGGVLASPEGPVDSPAGGQSGTEGGEGQEACSEDPPTEISPERFHPVLGARPSEVARLLEGTHTLGAGESMTLELGPLIGARLTPPPCKQYVLLDFPARVFEGDVLVEEVTAAFAANRGGLRVSWNYRNDASAALQSVELTFSLDGEAVVGGRADVQWHGERAEFVNELSDHISNWEPFVPPAEFADACADVLATPFGSESQLQFASDADVLATLNGTWALCEAPDVYPSFVGVRIENGAWHHIVLGDQGLEERHGFDHEGRVLLYPGFDSGTYQINLWSLPDYSIGLWLYPEGLRTIQEDEPAIQRDGEVLWLTSLVRTPLSASPAPDLPYSPGQRAGAAACDTPERGMLDASSSAEVALQALAGRWQRCSGALPELLEFDTLGAVRALDEAGAIVLEGQIRFPNGFPDRMNTPGTLLIDMSLPVFSDTYSVAFSETPRKLLLKTYIDGLQPLVTVYSAVP